MGQTSQASTHMLPPCHGPLECCSSTGTHTRHTRGTYQATSVLWVKGHLPAPPDACAHSWLQGCKGKCLLHGDSPWPPCCASADMPGPLRHCHRLSESLWAPGGAPPSRGIHSEATGPQGAGLQLGHTPCSHPLPSLPHGASVHHSLSAWCLLLGELGLTLH